MVSPEVVASVHPLTERGFKLKCKTKVLPSVLSNLVILRLASLPFSFRDNLKSFSVRERLSSTKKLKGVCLVNIVVERCLIFYRLQLEILNWLRQEEIQGYDTQI